MEAALQCRGEFVIIYNLLVHHSMILLLIQYYLVLRTP